MPASMRINGGMRMFRIICLMQLLGLSSCSYLVGKAAKHGMFDKQLAKIKRTGEAKLIGTIELVNPEQNYVLVNCDHRLNIPAGTEIVSQGADGAKSKLKVSPERKGNYITADITEGTPQVRDLVLYRMQPGDLPAPGALPGATPAPLEGPPVHLTPVMQADVIPPLHTPFQPLTPAPVGQHPQPMPAVRSPAPKPQPVPSPSPEPDLDPSGLPPVIR